MSFLLKTIICIYAFSVLIFSSQSQGMELVGLNSHSIEFMPSSYEGQVFEQGGYLFFESGKDGLVLIHSNSFKYFENKTLPLKVKMTGLLNTNSRYDADIKLLQVLKTPSLN